MDEPAHAVPLDLSLPAQPFPTQPKSAPPRLRPASLAPSSFSGSSAMPSSSSSSSTTTTVSTTGFGMGGMQPRVLFAKAGPVARLPSYHDVVAPASPLHHHPPALPTASRSIPSSPISPARHSTPFAIPAAVVTVGSLDARPLSHDRQDRVELSPTQPLSQPSSPSRLSSRHRSLPSPSVVAALRRIAAPMHAVSVHETATATPITADAPATTMTTPTTPSSRPKVALSPALFSFEEQAWMRTYLPPTQHSVLDGAEPIGVPGSELKLGRASAPPGGFNDGVASTSAAAAVIAPASPAAARPLLSQPQQQSPHHPQQPVVIAASTPPPATPGGPTSSLLSATPFASPTTSSPTASPQRRRSIAKGGARSTGRRERLLQPSQRYALHPQAHQVIRHMPAPSPAAAAAAVTSTSYTGLLAPGQSLAIGSSPASPPRLAPPSSVPWATTSVGDLHTPASARGMLGGSSTRRPSKAASSSASPSTPRPPKAPARVLPVVDVSALRREHAVPCLRDDGCIRPHKHSGHCKVPNRRKSASMRKRASVPGGGAEDAAPKHMRVDDKQASPDDDGGLALNSTCPMPGCDGRGNVNPKFRLHFSLGTCPLHKAAGGVSVEPAGSGGPDAASTPVATDHPLVHLGGATGAAVLGGLVGVDVDIGVEPPTEPGAWLDDGGYAPLDFPNMDWMAAPDLDYELDFLVQPDGAAAGAGGDVGAAMAPDGGSSAGACSVAGQGGGSHGGGASSSGAPSSTTTPDSQHAATSPLQ